MNNASNEWAPVEPSIAKRIGLTGAGQVRFHNGCVYLRHIEGCAHFGWFELQVPSLPDYAPKSVEDEPVCGSPVRGTKDISQSVY